MSALDLCQCGHLRRHHDVLDGCISLSGRGWLCECKNFTSGPTAASSCADAQPSIYPDAAERRRYALLEAAAVIGGWQMNSCSEVMHEAETLAKCAEVLLAEIERLEQERANG